MYGFLRNQETDVSWHCFPTWVYFLSRIETWGFQVSRSILAQNSFNRNSQIPADQMVCANKRLLALPTFGTRVVCGHKSLAMGIEPRPKGPQPGRVTTRHVQGQASPLNVNFDLRYSLKSKSVGQSSFRQCMEFGTSKVKIVGRRLFVTCNLM